MARKQSDEQRLRDAVAKDERFKGAADAWDKIAGATKLQREINRDFTFMERGVGFGGTLFGIARTLLRAAEDF